MKPLKKIAWRRRAEMAPNSFSMWRQSQSFRVGARVLARAELVEQARSLRVAILAVAG